MNVLVHSFRNVSADPERPGHANISPDAVSTTPQLRNFASDSHLIPDFSCATASKTNSARKYSARADYFHGRKAISLQFSALSKTGWRLQALGVKIPTLSSRAKLRDLRLRALAFRSRPPRAPIQEPPPSLPCTPNSATALCSPSPM